MESQQLKEMLMVEVVVDILIEIKCEVEGNQIWNNYRLLRITIDLPIKLILKVISE